MLTFETKIHDKNLSSFLEDMNALFGRLERKYYKEVHVKTPDDLNQFKRAFCKENGISSTHFNSIKNSCDGKVKSLIELRKYHVGELKQRIQDTEKTVKKIGKRIKQADSNIARHHAYTLALKEYRSKKEKGQPCRKPRALLCP